MVTVFIVTIPYQVGKDISHQLLKIGENPISTKTEHAFIYSVFAFAILYALGRIVRDVFVKKAINKNYSPKKWNEISYKDIKQVILRYCFFIAVLSAFSFSCSFFLGFLQQQFSFTLPIPEITYVIVAMLTLKPCILTPLLYKKSIA